MTNTNKPILVLAGVLGLGLITGYVTLSAMGIDAGPFGTFALMLLPGLAALWAATESSKARQQSEQTASTVDRTAATVDTVREQTNGVLSGPLVELTAKVDRIGVWIEAHDAVTETVRTELADIRAIHRHELRSESSDGA